MLSYIFILIIIVHIIYLFWYFKNIINSLLHYILIIIYCSFFFWTCGFELLRFLIVMIFVGALAIYFLITNILYVHIQDNNFKNLNITFYGKRGIFFFSLFRVSIYNLVVNSIIISSVIIDCCNNLYIDNLFIYFFVVHGKLILIIIFLLFISLFVRTNIKND